MYFGDIQLLSMHPLSCERQVLELDLIILRVEDPVLTGPSTRPSGLIPRLPR